MNAGVQVYFWLSIIVLYIPRSGIAWSYGSVQFSFSVVSNSLQPHELQHARLCYPPLSPVVCSSSCPLSHWCYLTISSSATPFSFCLQSFPASGSFLMSQLFASGGQSIGASASASASVLPMNIQVWFPLELIDLLAVQGTLMSLLQHHSSKASVLWCRYEMRRMNH